MSVCNTLYQWVCQVYALAPTNIRMELNSQTPLRHQNREVYALTVDAETDSITPEPVQGSKGTEERPQTVFYPDTTLWCDLRSAALERFGRREEQRRIFERALEGYYAPVEICARSSQVLGVRSVSTRLWTC